MPLYFPFLMIYQGYFNSTTLLKEKTLWYQNFKEKSKFNLNLTVTNYPHFQRRFFHNSQFLAYFDTRGKVTHKIFIDSQSILSPQNEGYLLMKKLGVEITYFDHTGKEKWSYPTLGYPILSPLVNNILLITTDNSTLFMIDRNQKTLIDPTYLGTMITDIEFCPYNDDVAIATIDSDLFFYDFLGKKQFHANIDSSEYDYIKSVECGFSGNFIAVLHGLNPEKLTLFNKNGEILWSQKTETIRRKKTTIGIDEANGIVYDQRGNQLFLLSLATGNLLRTIPLNQIPIKYSLFSNEPNYFLVGLNHYSFQNVHLYDLEGNLIWKKKFNDPFLQYVEIKQSDENPNTLNILIILSAKVYAYQIS